MAKVYHKSSLYGGEGGQAWDDDVFEGVRKVYVGQDSSRITYVKFEYETEEGQVVTREYGKINQQPKEFAIQYPVEHITVVEGNYSSVITNLLFKTSKGRKSPLFGPSLLGITSGKKFNFEDGGKKIVGFHGRSGNALDAFGIYFGQGLLNMPPSFSPLYKLDAQGGTSGCIWDDGPFDGVKAWTIGQDGSRITYVEFEYEKDSDLVTRHHGVKNETTLKFVLNPNECITSVEASYEKPDMFRNIVIRSLKFETSEGRRTFYGYNFGKKYLLEQKGLKIVGFHGREGSAIDAFGAYFAPVYTPTPLDPLKKLPAIGGEGGESWDDGVYDDVRKIFVGLGNDCVAFVKFEYLKDQDIVLGNDHGKQTLLEVEEFWLGDGENLTTIDGYYDKINGMEEPVITCLRFKTNRKESIPYGLDCGEKFMIGEEDHKIVGFHGQASDVIHSIGVTLAPFTPTQ